MVQNSPYHDALERVLAELESRSIPPCAVTNEARRAVETRLYNLPRLYDELERADGLDALLMSHEIRRVEKGAGNYLRGRILSPYPHPVLSERRRTAGGGNSPLRQGYRVAQPQTAA